MKKLIIGLFSLGLFVAVQAQESEVLSAYEYMKVYRSEKENGNMAVAAENLLNAKKAIDAAALNEKTTLKSKTWKRRADIYVAMFAEKNPAFSANKAEYLNTAYESIMKAVSVEVNPKNNEPKIAEEQELRSRAAYIGDTITKLGAANYEKENYADAVMYFEKSYNLYKPFGITDTILYRNIFFSAFLANDYDKAIQVGTSLMNMKYNDASVYGAMSQIYQNKGEGEKGLQLIKDARTKFPQKTEFIIEEYNYYMSKNDDANAILVMEDAAKAFASKPDMLKQLYFNSGVMLGKKGEKEKSREYYNKALAIDASYFAALNNLASSYLDEANAIIKEANMLKLGDKRYDELKAQSDALYRKAGGMLEQAYDSKVKEIATTKSEKTKAELTAEQGKLKDALLKIYVVLNDEAKIQQYESK